LHTNQIFVNMGGTKIFLTSSHTRTLDVTGQVTDPATAPAGWGSRDEKEEPIIKKSKARIANIKDTNRTVLAREADRDKARKQQKVQDNVQEVVEAWQDASAGERYKMNQALKEFLERLRCNTYSNFGNTTLRDYIKWLARTGNAPCIDRETGLLKDRFLALGKPEDCPYILWFWLAKPGDVAPVPCTQADPGGWDPESGLTAVWLGRWQRQELSASEIKAPGGKTKRQRVGFVRKDELEKTVRFDKEQPPVMIALRH
jgi:hypothetical protein